ncbi:CDP-diacylglycerol--glycerol-3-phosphate 3-phosphatidyltransferase [Cladophialophora chaetospira]|uniref:CDP-diacylglycerol--glycerol-3-phosphate 3-phosphatidyltransferase n=1 Tax=Cladophialophora chaetospira TaxID=386627 RepID=A0AA39CD28_9EURO|nr:CDP-diacylglycerol--glycerol-3-phosphate 3-phosphatidyltransferase [Cladophialophora chaetospira]
MFGRSVARGVLRSCTRTSRATFPRAAAKRIVSRRFSSSSTSAPASNGPAPAAHQLAGVASQLDRVVPRFEIDPDNIEILDGPTAFYDTLKVKIRGAKRRIYLSTLYIGKTERELFETLKEALEANPDLEVSILTDALRGTREDPNPSCATLLAPLITQFGDRVRISMFHTPNLNGWKKKYMPKRINEGWGLQHMKLYGFDDEIMLSGANLSDDYFTNRLDRYHLFSSKELTDFYATIHEAVCDLSYNLIPSDDRPGGFELLSPHERGFPDPLWHTKRFKRYAKETLEPLIHKKARQKMFPVEFTEEKTFVYPLAQFDILLGEPKNIALMDYEFAQYTSTEKPAMTKLLKNLADDERLHRSTWAFTAGYFNIDPDICNLLIAAAPEPSGASTALIPGKEAYYRKSCTVITASPWANGFYGSRGVSGMLPAAYTLLSRRFLRAVNNAGKKDVIQLKEWRKGTVGEPDGMTYHAKGLWVTLPPKPDGNGELVEDSGPSITVVGSSNYTKRSYSLDLEIGAMILTGDEGLKKRLKEEVENLEADATVTTQDTLARVDRRVGFRVRAALWLVEALGGAL